MTLYGLQYLFLSAFYPLALPLIAGIKIVIMHVVIMKQKRENRDAL